MKIKLDWVNRNTIDQGVKIFRAESPFETIDAMTPLAELPPGTQSFEDLTAEANKTYYYRTYVYNDADSFLGKQVTISTYPHTGPGPQTLVWGDYECGYFGEIVDTDFITSQELALKCNVQSGSFISNVAYLKFARKGKILFIPKTTTGSGQTWKALYDAGLVFGDTPVEEQFLDGITPLVEQNKIIDINGEYFRVRLPKGLPDGQKQAINFNAYGFISHTEYLGAELDELILPLMAQFLPSQSGPSYGNALPPTFNYSSCITLCQEGYDATRRLARMNYTYAGGSGFPLPNVGSAPFGGITQARATAWRPVLEYVFDNL